MTNPSATAVERKRNSPPYIRHLLKATLLSFFFLSAAGAAPPNLPPELLSQWSRFQAALKTNDVKLLAEVTHFPLKSNEFGGDIKSAKVLEQRYKTIFPEKTKKCLLASTLQRQEYEGTAYYEVYCDVGAYPIRFIFEKVGPNYYFSAIDNINE